MPIPHYQARFHITFSNENEELIEIWLKQKDYVGDVTELTSEQQGCKVRWLNNDEDKFSPIRASECTIFIWLETDDIGLDTFIGEDKSWKVDIINHTDGSNEYWQGFIVQEETRRPMQDLPYTIELRATDGLGRLKEESLTTWEGEKFLGYVTPLDVIAQILWKLNPYLGLHTHFSIYETTMDDRTDDPEADPLAQVKFEARMFKNNQTTWDDEYTVLEKILISWGAVLFQQSGNWHIVDLQDYLYGYTSYTTYSFDLSDPDEYVITTTGYGLNEPFVAGIAKAGTATDATIFPTLEDQYEGLKFANKSVKYTYRYDPIEVPKNENWREGDIIIPLGGVDWRAYAVNDWDFGQVVSLATPGGTLAGTTANHYRRSNINAFGFETESFLAVDSVSGEQIWMRAEPIPVVQNDKFIVSVGFKTTSDLSPGTGVPMRVWVAPADGSPTRYGLDPDGTWDSTGIAGVAIAYASGDPSTEWHEVTVESDPIPETGTLYIAIETQFNGGAQSFFREFSFEYLPYIDGGYRPVKGDYNLIDHTISQKKKMEREVFMTDGVRKILKGSMVRENEVLTTPEWFRWQFPAEDFFRFGSFQALKEWWHTRTNCLKVEGSFDQLFFYDTSAAVRHIGLLNLFEFLERGDDKRYMLTNFEVDLKTGIWNGIMIECPSENYDTVPDTREYNYIFE